MLIPRRQDLPTAPGLGVELDLDALVAAHQVHLAEGLGARDDAAAMQYLVPGWGFDPERAALGRH